MCEWSLLLWRRKEARAQSIGVFLDITVTSPVAKEKKAIFARAFRPWKQRGFLERSIRRRQDVEQFSHGTFRPETTGI